MNIYIYETLRILCNYPESVLKQRGNIVFASTHMIVKLRDWELTRFDDSGFTDSSSNFHLSFIYLKRNNDTNDFHPRVYRRVAIWSTLTYNCRRFLILVYRRPPKSPIYHRSRIFWDKLEIVLPSLKIKCQIM